MDFEAAAQRLAREQSKLKGRRNVVVSAKAKREADYRKKQQERMRAERERKQRQLEYQKKYMTWCERNLSVRSLGSKNTLLTATSIHGEGDKIALPPSLLESMTSSQQEDDMDGSSPWTFRIGILNPDYAFPASPLIQSLKEESEGDDDEDDDEDDSALKAYLDELAHKYLSYTHCTVVEFTQEEGHVGLPLPIASALLAPRRQDASIIPVMRTVDPAGTPDVNKDDAMEVDDEEKTPGHLAWGAFDVPKLPIEITKVKLPKGRGCTLIPTEEAVRNGFYSLKDVKLVLEQSLIRTRATLSVGDTLSTWHRGVQFKLTVEQVSPASYGAITCINTDIEVTLGTREQEVPPEETKMEGGHVLGSGRLLSSSEPVSPAADQKRPSSLPVGNVPSSLLPEPPVDQTDNVCTVQVRADGSSGKRRFDVSKATVKDLLDFAATVAQRSTSSFRLVASFPRRVYSSGDGTEDRILSGAGVQHGQELFRVELV